jgi:multiple sugar transport system substrate-binding protein
MKRFWLVVPLALVLVASACSGGSGNDDQKPGGPIELTMWMGYTPPPPVEESLENISLNKIVDAFNAANPDIHVTTTYVNSDKALTKALTALQGGLQPDISYQYGTNMARLATTPKLVDLTDRVNNPSYKWDDFFEGERAVATVDGKVFGVPALVDNLAVVYNKDLFEAAGLPEPTPDWTWADFQADAAAIADPSKKISGVMFPADGSETTVWEYEAMLWAAGGDILNADNTEAVFNSAAGVRALTTLQQMRQAGSLDLDFNPDSGKYSNLFNSGNMGMVITGPWDLGAFPNVNYGVQVMPSFDPGGNHLTIAGPDNWVIFDNGPARVDAAWKFLTYLTSPDVVLQDSLDTSHLPTRASVRDLPGFAPFEEKYKGTETFVQNLENVQKARPQIESYPTVSSYLGQAVVSVLTGDAQPQEALDQAAEQSNAELAAP